MQIGSWVGAAQLVAQRVGEGAEFGDERRGFLRRAGQGEGLAGEGAGFDQEHAPQRARFPVAGVGGAVSEAQEDRQRQADEGEGYEVEGDCPAEDRPVQHCDDNGKHRGGDELRRYGQQNRAAQYKQHAQPVQWGTDDHGAYCYAAALRPLERWPMSYGGCRLFFGVVFSASLIPPWETAFPGVESALRGHENRHP